LASTFGKIFTITTFGESHGGSVGVVIDGCPGGIKISLDKIQNQLDRRKPGQSALSTPRKEDDRVICLSGLENGITLGSPITLIVNNKDQKPEHYSDLKNVYRPSHADFTYEKKYGVRASSGGGRSSARETIGRVAAGALAEQVLEHFIPGYKNVAYVDKVKDIKMQSTPVENLTRDKVDETDIRCPDEKIRKKMEKLILNAKKSGDSVGGSIYCQVSGVPVGLGEPIFDKLHADLAKALMSLPATRFFEVGLGEGATELFGSEHNDEFVSKDGVTVPATNKSGGIQGGISNGAPILVRLGFKPVATIFKSQKTTNTSGDEVTFKPKAGRHDPCVLPRAVPMVEAMINLVILDHYLRMKALKNS
jgi:chorismate synthase